MRAADVLIAAAFLQEPTDRRRPTRLGASALRRMPAADLADVLDVPLSPAVHSAAAALHRPGGARRVLAALRTADADRIPLRRALRDVSVPVTLVAGADDPLTNPVPRPVPTVPGAGHYPQLTHPDTVARILDEQGSPTTT
ncbi:alpha/beta hydrolase [Streptomyces sp. NPDC096046]|uniref:alpha/beta fold hydrolase n=1 Tax=Streptomyces sp. NPDC096046 TaxID=3155542 RepID=UPI003318CD54